MNLVNCRNGHAFSFGSHASAWQTPNTTLSIPPAIAVQIQNSMSGPRVVSVPTIGRVEGPSRDSASSDGTAITALERLKSALLSADHCRLSALQDADRAGDRTPTR